MRKRTEVPQPTPEANEPRADYWQKRAKTAEHSLQEAVIKREAVDVLIEQAHELAPKSYQPLDWSFDRPLKATGCRPQSAVLMLSDSHVGQVVDPDETLGVGAYNFELFLRRLKRLERSIFSILQDHTTTSVPEIVVAMLGDMLHGNLQHSVEAGQTNTLFDQFYCAGHALAQFLQRLTTLAPVRVHTAVGNHCVDERTEILTRRGWLKHSELEDSDFCVGILPDGKTAVWQPIQQIIREKAIEDIITIRNGQFSFRGTEHHRFYFRPNLCSAFLEAPFCEIEELVRQHGIQIPSAAQVVNSGRADLEPFLALCGAVLTDGSIDKDGRVFVYQKKEKSEWVTRAFETSGLKYSIYERTRRYPKEIAGRKLTSTGEYTERAYALSAESSRAFLGATQLKKGELPAWAWDLSKSQVDVFLRAILEGDGAGIDTSSPCLIGKSAKFIDQLSSLCAVNGIGTTVGESRGYPRIGLRMNTAWVGVGATGISREKATGETVWCVRTGTENFLCRREGRPYFTGNTRWGHQKKMPTDNRYSNADQFLFAYVQALTRDIPTIQFNLDRQPFALFEVQGHQFFAGHGDHLRGGDRILGIPSHAFGRNVATHSQLASRTGRNVPEYYLFGHLHRSITLPHVNGEILVNGGFAGIDGYGLAEAFNSTPPTQRFFLMHEKFGRTACYDLRLDFGDTEMHDYSLPDTNFTCL